MQILAPFSLMSGYVLYKGAKKNDIKWLNEIRNDVFGSGQNKVILPHQNHHKLSPALHSVDILFKRITFFHTTCLISPFKNFLTRSLLAAAFASINRATSNNES